MNYENVSLLNMFPDYNPPEAHKSVLAQAAIVAADIDPQMRRVDACLHAPMYIPQRELNQISAEIAASYGLQKFSLIATFPADQLHRIEIEELMTMFMEENSMCRGSLAGSSWDWEDTVLNISLKANGKVILEECLPAYRLTLDEL